MLVFTLTAFTLVAFAAQLPTLSHGPGRESHRSRFVYHGSTGERCGHSHPGFATQGRAACSGHPWLLGLGTCLILVCGCVFLGLPILGYRNGCAHPFRVRSGDDDQRRPQVGGAAASRSMTGYGRCTVRPNLSCLAGDRLGSVLGSRQTGGNADFINHGQLCSSSTFGGHRQCYLLLSDSCRSSRYTSCPCLWNAHIRTCVCPLVQGSWQHNDDPSGHCAAPGTGVGCFRRCGFSGRRSVGKAGRGERCDRGWGRHGRIESLHPSRIDAAPRCKVVSCNCL